MQKKYLTFNLKKKNEYKNPFKIKKHLKKNKKKLTIIKTL